MPATWISEEECARQGKLLVQRPGGQGFEKHQESEAAMAVILREVRSHWGV